MRVKLLYLLLLQWPRIPQYDYEVKSCYWYTASGWFGVQESNCRPEEIAASEHIDYELNTEA